MSGDAFEHYQATNLAFQRGEASWDDVIEAWGLVGVAHGEMAGLPWLTSRRFIAAPGFSFQSMDRATARSFLETPKERNRRIVERAQRTLERLRRRSKHGFAKTKTSPTGRSYVDKIHRVWFSRRLSRYVFIVGPDNKRRLHLDPEAWWTRYEFLIGSHNVSHVYSFRAEMRAMELLATMITDDQMSNYVISGTFVERSERSGVTYVFRRMRPTIATRGPRILTCLCLHPMGFYEATWAGGMVPTDDVVTHLQWMRADERRYWGKANHHPPWLPTAGI